jgi:enterochelin esterase-like enzyme
VNAKSDGGIFALDTLAFDGGRHVSVYLPSRTPVAVVFAADGGSVAQWGELLEGPDVPPTAIVGVHGLTDEMQRLEEYSPVFNPDRFAAHEEFFVEEVRLWARDQLGLDLPSERTAVFGASAGGELAIALGILHPDVYGTILAGSPGAGYRPPESLPTRLPRTYLLAGTQEPFFLDNADRWARALRDAGAEVVFQERDADHGSELWRSEFPLMIQWAFG